MVKLNIKHLGEKFTFKADSMLLEFLTKSKSLKSEVSKLCEKWEIEIPKVLLTDFLDEKSSELKSFSSSKPESFVIAKVDLEKNFSADFFRNYIAGFVKGIKLDTISNLYIKVPDYENFQSYFHSEEYYYQSFIEGLYLGTYSFDVYKSEKDKPKSVNVFLISQSKEKTVKAISKGTSISESVYFTRDLINEPAITLTPVELANRTKKELTKYGVKVTVYNKKELEKRNMHAILAVGNASDNPPCLIEMNYKPRGAKKKILLVGKGLTYDAGGLSIKPTEGMIDMNVDMAGAGTVIGTLLAAAKLKLKVEIIGLVPAAENMISGNSYKPGDIINSYSGKSIEVKNTDAEGRIVLADALAYGMKKKPDTTIDLATLTGACVVALGEYAAGLFTKDDKLAAELGGSGYETHERVWRLPMWDEYAELIKSDLADVANLGSKWGGAITAAKFLENFVEKDTSWAHIDIAGPSCKNKLNNYTKDFHPGFGVRLLVNYLENK
ncbi:MAG: leucyl aminopeptidase [Melioribacteraceae bacterium]|nr:leucyl aminopeptidase [Melioribacteraceae bacterium]